jgi:uncharacterized membrane protein
MPSDWIVYACLAVGIANGTVAGVFQSFSDFGMRSLAAARPYVGIQAMQLINRKVYQSLFLVFLLGLAPVSLVAIAYAYLTMAGPELAWIITESSIYMVCVFLVTILANVPMNKRLDGMDPRARHAAEYWKTYAAVWTRWNHVRALGSAATAICFLLAGVALV